MMITVAWSDGVRTEVDYRDDPQLKNIPRVLIPKSEAYILNFILSVFSANLRKNEYFLAKIFIFARIQT